MQTDLNQRPFAVRKWGFHRITVLPSCKIMVNSLDCKRSENETKGVCFPPLPSPPPEVKTKHVIITRVKHKE